MEELFELLEPKQKNWGKVKWKISKRTKAIVAQYAEYSGRDESHVVDFLLAQIMRDQEFVKWLGRKRYQIRIKDKIFGDPDPKLDEAMKEVNNDDPAKNDCPF